MELIGQLGKIAGIAGVSLGILLFVFRDIIKKLPILTKKDAYNTIKLVTWLTWSVAILGIFIWKYPNQEINQPTKRYTPVIKEKINKPKTTTQASEKQLKGVERVWQKKSSPSPKYQINGSIINSAVGDSASVTNIYNGPMQRRLTDDELKKLINSIPSKTSLLTIIITANNSEIYTYAKEIADKLILLGYNVNKNLGNGSTAFLNNENFIIENGNEIYIKAN